MDAKTPEKNGRWKQWKRYVLIGFVPVAMVGSFLLGVLVGEDDDPAEGHVDYGNGGQ